MRTVRPSDPLGTAGRRFRVRVFSVHPVARDAYESALRSEPAILLVSPSENSEVVICEDTLAGMSAFVTLGAQAYRDHKIIVLVREVVDGDCLRWLARGVWGIVPYASFRNELVRAVRTVCEGRLWFPAEVLQRTAGLLSTLADRDSSSDLTAREREVAGYLRLNLSNKEIANLLGITERTVKFHVGSVFHKLHINSRRALSAGP